MVISYEEAGRLMDEIADSFPQEFYDTLTSPVLLLPEVKYHPEASDLYVMGTYCHNALGRYIELYYGSFARMAQEEDWSMEDWEDELWGTLSHEFTHHLESMAGERSLEDKDEAFMEDYWEHRGR